ncbi:MAG TPA: type II secretion system F family protein [Actinomycetota bacterium]
MAGPVVTGLAAGASILAAAAERRRMSRRIESPVDPTGGRAAALLGAGLCSAAAGLLLFGPLASLLACGGLVGWGLIHRAKAREAEALETERGLRDAVRALAASARAGLSIRRSLEEVARGGPAAVAGPFRRAAGELVMGRPLPAALASLSDGLGSREAAMLTGVLSIHHRAGGDLPTALDEVAALAERRAEARRRVRALTAQGRASGAVLALLPVAFVGLLSGTSGNGLGTIYASPRGAALLGAGLVLQLVGYAWIRAILRRAQP